MIARRIKLQPMSQQVEQLNGLLWQYAGLYNWAVRKLWADGRGGIWYTKYELATMVNGHAAKCGLNTHTMRQVLWRALRAHRARSNRGVPARLKSVRNRLNSIPLADKIKLKDRTHIQLPGIGPVKMRPGKDFPAGSIKAGVVSRKARGWYVTLQIEAEPRPIARVASAEAGVDFGFSTLATLSSGEKIPNPKEYHRVEARLGQANRGHNRRLRASLHQRLSEARRCRNHQISRDLISRHSVLYLSRDNYRAMQRTLGKSVHSAAIYQLITMLHAKSRPGGCRVIEVTNVNSTRGCSTCGALTGPTGRRQLSVRTWSCSACGAEHDRDQNAAMQTLKFGAALAHEMAGDRLSETPRVGGSSAPPLARTTAVLRAAAPQQEADHG